MPAISGSRPYCKKRKNQENLWICLRPPTRYLHTYMMDYQDKGPRRAPQPRANSRATICASWRLWFTASAAASCLLLAAFASRATGAGSVHGRFPAATPKPTLLPSVHPTWVHVVCPSGAEESRTKSRNLHQSAQRLKAAPFPLPARQGTHSRCPLWARPPCAPAGPPSRAASQSIRPVGKTWVQAPKSPPSK